MSVLTLSPEDHPCLCCARHSPRIWLTEAHHIWPKQYGGPEHGETVALCANAHYTVHYRHLMPWVAYAKVYGGQDEAVLLAIPFKRQRSENRYAYAVARDGWERMVEGGWRPGA